MACVNVVCVGACLIKRLANSVFDGIVRQCGPVWKTRLWYLRVHRNWPNLKRPAKFSEKIAFMKLNASHQSKVSLTDKVLVKDHVSQAIGAEFVIPTLWSGASLPPRHERNWPLPFVLKANHGSAMNILVRSEKDLDWDRIEGFTAQWLQRDWPDHLCEDWYNRIDRKLLVEPLIGRPGQDLPDYKVFVFSGQAHLVQVDSDRFSRHTRAYYDRNWSKVAVRVEYPLNKELHPRPVHLEKMLAAAEQLGKAFDFVRVDFFDLPEGPKFGEITFAPDAGLGRFQPRHYDHVFGRIWDESAADANLGRYQPERAMTLLHDSFK